MSSGSGPAEVGSGYETLIRAAEAAVRTWSESHAAGRLAPATAALYQRQLDAFVAFAAAHRVDAVRAVPPGLCLAWIRSLGRATAGSHSRGPTTVPSASTMRLRRAVLVAAFSVWSTDGLVAVSPVPAFAENRPERGRPAPLTPPEVNRLREASLLGPRDLVAAAGMAAALAGAAQSEIARLTVSDVDLDDATLSLVGRGRSGARRVRFGPSGMAALKARLNEAARASRRLGSSESALDSPLALRRPLASYSPHAVAPAVASTLSRAMKRAGITRPGVRPGSLRDYAANRIYAITGRVEDVAEVVGLASLDRARALVDPEWQARWADAARVDEG